MVRRESRNKRGTKKQKALMHLKTILNRLAKFKIFVVGEIAFDNNSVIEMSLGPRKHSCPICSCRGFAGSNYDQRPARHYGVCTPMGD